jgi:hypothetical protein
MHGAAQKACEPGETVAQNSFTETNQFSFPTWTVRRSLCFLLFFSFCFDCFPFFFPFFLSFLFDLLHHGTGMGGREVAAR